MAKSCSKCDKPHYAKGMCRNHYRESLRSTPRGRPAFAVLVPENATVEWWSDSKGKLPGDVYKLGIEQLHALLAMPAEAYDISLRSRFINAALGLENAGTDDLREEFRRMQREMQAG